QRRGRAASRILRTNFPWPSACHATSVPGTTVKSQRRDQNTAKRNAVRTAVWTLARLAVLLGSGLVLAGATAQASAAAAPSQISTQRLADANKDSSPPSEPAGHRPAAGTTSLLVKLASGLTANQQHDLVAAGGGIERAVIPALHLVVIDVPAAQVEA